MGLIIFFTVWILTVWISRRINKILVEKHGGVILPIFWFIPVLSIFVWLAIYCEEIEFENTSVGKWFDSIKWWKDFTGKNWNSKWDG